MMIIMEAATIRDAALDTREGASLTSNFTPISFLATKSPQEARPEGPVLSAVRPCRPADGGLSQSPIDIGLANCYT